MSSIFPRTDLQLWGSQPGTLQLDTALELFLEAVLANLQKLCKAGWKEY